MMHSLAMDLKGTAIRVNSVLPSIIDTAANRRDMPRANFATWTKPEDIARVILFLCTEDARALNGTAIPV
jgi:NAD(P)-dependent dehydrogenase (short-subunit alcohol dehydrogenase family)